MRTALSQQFARLRRDEKGATLVEYGIALLIATAVGVAGMGILGTETGLKVSAACDTLQQDADGAC